MPAPVPEIANRTVRRSWSQRPAVVLVVSLSLMVALAAAFVPAVPASAAGIGTILFQNAFNDRTVDGTGTVTVPTPPSGPNTACLTASGNSATLPLLSCSGLIDSQGSGKLRLTSSTINQVGGVFGQNSFPTSNGLDVTFKSYQWGGNSADGIAFMLAAVDPANPVAPTTMGPSGGSLGYSRAGSVKGLTNGYLGIGLDVFGNFSSNSYSGTGCTNPANISVQAAGSVVVRGPGSGTVGYCGLNTTSDGTIGTKLILRAATRAASVVPVQVLINPTLASFTSETGVSVAAGTYKVVVTPVGQPTKTLTGTLPTVSTGLYPSASWLDANGVPKQLAFGFVGSTGSVTDVHEISDVKVLTFNPVPQLGVSAVSYSAASSQPGDPVTYKVTADVLAGADETSPISVTETMPIGTVPVGAYGTGWACQAPVGRTVTCTTTGSSFVHGTTMPVINVVGIVTGANVSATFIQSNSSAQASSTDAGPGSDMATTAGTLPTTPTGISLLPSIGGIGGGASTVLTGANISAATAVEIGTAAEQQAGTPVTLLPCSGGTPAAGCFTQAGNTITVSSWPARSSAATVTVTVVTSGVAAAANYVYADKPASPATPTATAGITSATVTWVTPASNGSPLTSYVITPYLGGVAQTPHSFDTTTTTRTLSGLTAGGAYTFTVSAVNAYGTSTASAASATVIPYALPGTPTITAVSAGTQAATLTWNSPSTNGSAITGYVITPYIGTVAQTAQTFTGSATTRTVTGLVAGTSYTFTVAAQNAAGTGPASAKSTAVIPNVSPSLTFTAPPSGEIGVPYSRQLTVTNGTSPFAWSVSAGTLPDGLTLNAATGLLSGTPTVSGTFGFTVQVTDASGQTATKAVTLVIAASPALTVAVPDGEVGISYSQQPTLTGGTGPFTWSVSAGSLPAGLTLSSTTGLLSGTPTASGPYPMTIQVVDSFNQVASKTVSLVIVARPAFGATTPATGQVGVPYSNTFNVTGGSLPLVWSIAAGSLPAGLSLNSATGVVSGTPTTTGSSPLTLSVIDANGQSASRSVTLTIAAGPLVIVKSANVSSTAPGSVVAYTISVTNTGSTAWTGANLSDPLTGVLDDAVYNANATASSGTMSYSSSTLGWTGNIAAGASVTITYSVTVNALDTGNKVLSNTVTSTTLGANCASGSGDARCSATVTVAGLGIVKTADVTTVTPGGHVDYTITVTNTGQSAYLGATLTDSLTGVLDDASYDADGSATSGSVSYTGSAVTWTGNLAVGATATITYSVTITDPDAGNRSLTGTIVSPSAGSSCPGGSPAPSCTVVVTVLVPALSITNTSAVSSATPGDNVAYTVTVANTGQTAYVGTNVSVALTDALDDSTYDNDFTATAGSVSYNATTQVLTWTGNLPVGGTVTITGSVTVHSPDPGDKTMTTVATSTAAGSTCPVDGSNPACTSTVLVKIPALSISTSATAGTTTPGSIVHYTLSITNSGQTPYVAAAVTDALAGALDDATYNGDAVTTAGAVSVSGTNLAWAGDLLVGATVTVSYSLTVRSPDTGDLALNTRATSTAVGNNCPAASTDSRCTSSVTVLLPGLSIVDSVDATTTTPGGEVVYSVTATNTGQTTYNNVELVLDFRGAVDDATYNNDATTTSGSQVSNGDGTATWTVTLAPGATATSTMSATVNSPPEGDKSLQTSVVSDAPGSTCPTGSASAACHTTVPVLIPGLTITKTADTSTVTPGGTVHYTVSVVNNGETTFTAAQFDDDLGHVLIDSVYNGDATATTGSLSYNASVLSWSGSLAPGASSTITYSVTVRDPDPGDKAFSNTVVSSSAGNNCSSGSTDPRCTVSVNVLVPALTITKTANAATTTPGAVVQYGIDVTNTGATTFSAASITDSLAGVLDDADYNADAATDSGTVVWSGSTLTWTGALSPGQHVHITYSVTVHAADGGDNLVSDTVTSGASGNNCPVDSADPRCTTVVPVARLVLSQSYPSPFTTPGSLLHLTATFTNTGQVPYTGISVASPSADTIDDAIPAGDQVASSGTVVLGATAITWTGSIPVGGVVTITGTLTVKDPATGNKVITGTLVSAASGNNCAPGSTDSRCTAIVAVRVPQLSISKVVSTTDAMPGDSVGYTITVHNSGETAYTGAAVTDSLAGVLNDASYNGDATASIGAVSYASSTLSWTGDLDVGDTATITYSVTADDPSLGDKSMANRVESTTVGSTCPPASSNPNCQTTVNVLTPSLTIVKTANMANATLGSTVGYTVTATNTGQTTYSTAAFTDSLAGVLDDATYDTDAASTTGTVGYVDGVLSWSGVLVPGESATVSYSVTIKNPASGDAEMTNTVVSTTKGSNCASGSTDSRCTATVDVTDAVSLTFTKTADVASTVAGATVNYMITVVNSTNSPIASAEFTDPLAGILDDATYNGDARATSGALSYTAPDLAWTGTIGAGSTVTVTYSVTVHALATGDQILEGAVSSSSLPTSDNCTAGSDDPRCASTVAVAGLLIEQHADSSTTSPGSVVHLTETFTNTGKVPYLGISVVSPRSDTSDDTITTGDQVASSGTLVRTATAVTWTGDIPVGGTVTSTRSLVVQNPDTGNKIITATLSSSASGNNCPIGGTDPVCTFRVDVQVPELTISKTASTTAVVPGGTVGYTIVVHNTGEMPYTGAAISDSLAGVLDDATYNAGATATSGAVSYTSSTLEWAGDLAVGASTTIVYSVSVRSPAVGDKTMVNQVESTTVGSTCPPASGNTACRATVAVLTPLLTFTSVASAATTVPGATISYTLTARNTGQTAYPSATFVVPLGGVLDDATYDGNVTATTGTADVTAGTLTWTGGLGTGAVVTIAYTVTVIDSPTGDHELDETITSTEQGNNCRVGGTDPRCTTSVLIAGLQISNSADAAETEPTAVVRNTVVLTNTGKVPYVGISVDDSFVGSLDDATYNGDAVATAGSLVLVAGSGHVVWTGDVPVGASVTVTGSLTVNNPDAGDQTMTTLVGTDASASNCPTEAPGADCLSSVAVLTPGLTVTKSADRSTATPGSQVAYTITVANTGETAYPAATVTDSLVGVLDDATLDNDASATIGSLTVSGATLTWTGALAAGDTTTITYSMTVNDPDTGEKSLVNDVVSDAIGSNCPTGGSAPSCSTVVTVLVPALDVAVTADRSTTVPGADVAYTVRISNIGQTDYTGASVTTLLGGVLDDAHYAGGATATRGAVSFTGQDLAWTGDVAMAETVIVTYVVTVDEPDGGDHLLVTSTTSSAPGSSCGNPSPCTQTVTVLTPGLAVSTTADAATAMPGDDVDFTITVTNTGQTSYTGTVVSSGLADILDDATFDGTVVASSGVASYNAPDISWTGTLSVGAAATITYEVTVRDPDQGNKVLSATVLAPAQGSTCQQGSHDPACVVTVTVLVPALTIRKSAAAPTTTPGGTVGYTIVITNTGETDYAAAAVSDSLSGVLPDADYNGDATVSGGGVLAYGGATLSWSGALPMGATATITYSITVHDPDTGDKLMPNSVVSTTPGSTCPPGSQAAACTTVVQVLIPALSIVKTADTTVVTAGQAVRYTVRLTNNGQTDYAPATFTDSLADVLDDASYNADATASAGVVVYADGTLAWSGALAVGATAVISYSVSTDFPATGDRSLHNAVRSTSPGASCLSGDEAGCETTVSVLVPALHITKTADLSEVVAGGVLHYTISATNVGEADYPSAALSDSLAGVLDDATYNGDATATSGVVGLTGSQLSWHGALPRGATVTITYSVSVPVTSTGTLTNTVTSTATGSTCTTGAEPGCATTTTIAERTLTLSGLTSSFTLTGLPGSTITSDGAVGMTVTTNDPGGYAVTVQAETPSLVALHPNNSAVIGIDQLRVRESSGSVFEPLSNLNALVVHQQSAASAPHGDAVSNDYQIHIPFVPSDTYEGTLDYIVSAQ
jgi:uncharacterized repeat protein (TIGR01451 family)